MNVFTDFSILSAAFNFLSMLGNVYWSMRLNSIRGSNELVSYWKAECDKKDNEIADLQQAVESLHKKLGVYQTFHGHKPLAYKDGKAYT